MLNVKAKYCQQMKRAKEARKLQEIAGEIAAGENF